MRLLLTLLVLVWACDGAETPDKQGLADQLDGGLDGSQSGDTADQNVAADMPAGRADGGDLLDAADAGARPDDAANVAVTANEYREPDVIRGGACPDPPPPTFACGTQPAAAVYCDVQDANRVVMAICSSSSRGSQCDAMDDCGPGWSACTATQYVERGGRDVQPQFSTTNRAWLAACVQDLGGQTLRNEPCAPCTEFDPAYDPAVMWWCDDASVVFEGGMDGDRLGVVTSPECFRVGQNADANAAWWALDFASSGPPFVVCCEDAF